MSDLQKRIVANVTLAMMTVAPLIGYLLPDISTYSPVWISTLGALIIVGILSARMALGWSWPMSFVMFIPGLLVAALALFLWCLRECGWALGLPSHAAEPMPESNKPVQDT